MSTATMASRSIETNEATDRLTETLEEKLSHPATSPDFDLHAATSEVLKDIGLTTADTGGKLTFYGSDPVRDAGRSRSGRKKRRGGGTLEASYRPRPGYLSGRAQSIAAF